MKIAIIGAGLIGRKRALALPRSIHIEVVCDVDKDRAAKFASEFKCKVETDWKKVISNYNIDALIVCTSNKNLSEIATKAILGNKHVLVEKPGARNLADLRKVILAHRKKKTVVMFGYNHRFHPAMLKAKKIIDSKKYGDVLFIRAKYGHGGRLGYEKEWRFKKEISGGGQLLDQGSHLIDLVNYFGGELNFKNASVDTLFWKTDLEDSAFLLLKKGKTTASLSTTCLEWKNLFSFEIMLERAKIQIDGLGRSYGPEKLTLYVMKPEMGPPNVTETTFPDEDLSWNRENAIFFKKIADSDFSATSLKEAEYVLKIINKAYLNK